MKLYGSPGACSQAAHIILEMIGENYEYVNTKKMDKEEVKKINPMGAVPILDDNGFILTQNVAILNYLADLYKDKGIAGDGSIKERALVNKWLGFVNSDIHPVYSRLFGCKFGNDVDSKADKDTIHAICGANMKKIMERFEICDKELQGKDWIAGTKTPTLADAYLFVTINWSSIFGMDLSKMENILSFAERMSDHPAVVNALKAEGL